MHDIVVDQFDKYLQGEASAAFHEHLAACPACHAEVLAMADVTMFLHDLKPDVEPAQPLPGFYNRVAGRIVEQERSDFWGFLAPGSDFFRRMAFASLLLLAGLGSFLVSRERAEGGADAAAIISQIATEGAPASVQNEVADRDRLLVTLANYRQ